MNDRTKFIGASDSPVILGYSKWKTIEELWNEKTGMLIPEDISDKPEIIRGNEWEPLILDIFRLENKELEVSGPTFHKHPEFNYLCATLDGSVVENGSVVAPVEVKTANGFRKTQSGWTDTTVPDAYLIQLMHQMLVTNTDHGYIVVRFFYPNGGTEKTYKIKRSEELCQKITTEAVQFWENVKQLKKPVRKWQF